MGIINRDEKETDGCADSLKRDSRLSSVLLDSQVAKNKADYFAERVMGGFSVRPRFPLAGSNGVEKVKLISWCVASPGPAVSMSGFALITLDLRMR